jgi:hypothetical protein
MILPPKPTIELVLGGDVDFLRLSFLTPPETMADTRYTSRKLLTVVLSLRTLASQLSHLRDLRIKRYLVLCFLEYGVLSSKVQFRQTANV